MDYPEDGRSPPEGAGGFSGFPSGGGGGQGPRGVKVRFTHSNPEDVFRNFFGSSDPFASGSSDDEGGGGGFPFMMGGQGGMHGT